MTHDASELIGTIVGDLGIGNDSVTKYFNFAMIDSPCLVKREVFQFTGEAEGVAEDIEISICVLLCNLQAVLVGKSDKSYIFLYVSDN